MRMYQLIEEYADLVVMLDDCENEEQAMEIIQQINAVTSDISDKGKSYALILQNFKADADELEAKAAIFKAEADRLTAKAKAKKNYASRLKEHLLFAMEIAGLKQIPTDIGKFYTQTTMSVEVLDAWKVPEKFTTPQPPKVDKDAIKREFRQTGELYEGVTIKVTEGLRFR